MGRSKACAFAYFGRLITTWTAFSVGGSVVLNLAQNRDFVEAMSPVDLCRKKL